MRFKVDRGNTIRFWKDVWVEETPLAECFLLLYGVANSRNESIYAVRFREAFIRSGGFSWNLRFNRSVDF